MSVSQNALSAAHFQDTTERECNTHSRRGQTRTLSSAQTCTEVSHYYLDHVGGKKVVLQLLYRVPCKGTQSTQLTCFFFPLSLSCYFSFPPSPPSLFLPLLTRRLLLLSSLPSLSPSSLACYFSFPCSLIPLSLSPSHPSLPIPLSSLSSSPLSHLPLPCPRPRPLSPSLSHTHSCWCGNVLTHAH